MGTALTLSIIRTLRPWMNTKFSWQQASDGEFMSKREGVQRWGVYILLALTGVYILNRIFPRYKKQNSIRLFKKFARR